MDGNRKIITQLEHTKSLIVGMLDDMETNFVLDPEDIRMLRKTLGNIRMVHQKLESRQNTLEKAAL